MIAAPDLPKQRLRMTRAAMGSAANQIAAIALANKIARMAWAMRHNGSRRTSDVM